jgi:SAM-dependent methyltransferase
MGWRINALLQKKCGGLRCDPIHGLPAACAMASALDECGYGFESITAVELGTGWDNSSAQALIALGASKVVTYDLYRHLDARLVEKAKRLIIERSGCVDDTFIPFKVNLDKIVSSLDASRLANADIEYKAPHDARHTELPDNSVDLYFSFAVLEHVGVREIPELLSESFRILKPGGVCYHYIQPSMHAALFDRTALAIDYLRISSFWWNALFSNPISHENRLRAPQYLAMFERSGFRIVRWWKRVDEPSLSALSRVRVAREFSAFTAEDLATNLVWVLAEKPKVHF